MNAWRNCGLRITAWLTVAVTLLLGMQLLFASSSYAASCPGIGCAAGQGGIDITSSRQSVLNLPKGPGDDGHGIYQPAADAPRYEYSSTPACPSGARPGEPGADSMCMGAVLGCANSTNGSGPLVRIWRRIVQVGPPPGPWELVGLTCWADVAPGTRPPLTMAMIQEAFNRTPWAKPQVSTQPNGNVTLVALIPSTR